MTVSKVGQNENSHLSTIVKSTAIGTAAGYSLKYLWPVTNQENDFNKRTVINYCRKVTNKNCISEFKSQTQPRDAAADGALQGTNGAGFCGQK